MGKGAKHFFEAQTEVSYSRISRVSLRTQEILRKSFTEIVKLFIALHISCAYDCKRKNGKCNVQYLRHYEYSRIMANLSLGVFRNYCTLKHGWDCKCGNAVDVFDSDCTSCLDCCSCSFLHNNGNLLMERMRVKKHAFL